MTITLCRSLLATAAVLAIIPNLAQARCDQLSNVKAGEINIIGNTFPALTHIAKEMETCTQNGLKVQFKTTPNARTEIEQAFASAGPAAFDAAVISGGVFSGLNARGQIQPMTDLVNKYRTKYKIEERMLVKVNGEVMAIAFMQNAQNLYYRKDVFAKHGIKVPSTYAEMIKTAAEIKQKEPGIEFPIAQTFARGWDSGAEFANIYVGHGGTFFEPSSARAAIVNDASVQTLETMKAMTKFMTPNYLASNSDDVMNQFQQGRAAMGVLWATRAERMDDKAASKIVGQMNFAAAPSIKLGGKSATHLWWDGMVMPKNLKGDRETVFQVMMEALDEETMKKGNDLAVWVRSAYKPTRFGMGVALSSINGAPLWPTQPYFGLMHTEIGKVLPDILTGAISPRAGMAIAAQSYNKVATEQGFIK